MSTRGRKAPSRKKAAPAKKGPAPSTRRKAPAAKRPAAAKKKAPATRSRPRSKTASVRPLAAQECSYSSVTFRSQLEARWAVFFDALAIDWDYEPCHYPIGDDLGYLPDFYLPGLGLWAEGKGPTFLDRHSMGKVLGAVAGPQPLPLREPPYWPNNGLLLLGPMQPLPDIGRPVHTLLLPEAPGLAGAWRSVWTTTGPVTVGSKPWATIPATGTPPARRPTPARTAELLTPTAEPSTAMDPSVAAAYRLAQSVQFTSDGRAQLPPPAAKKLAHRRRGRPLRPEGAFALAGVA